MRHGHEEKSERYYNIGAKDLNEIKNLNELKLSIAPLYRCRFLVKILKMRLPCSQARDGRFSPLSFLYGGDISPTT